MPVYKGMSVTQTTGNQAIGKKTTTAPNIVVVSSYKDIANPFYQLKEPMPLPPFCGDSFNNKGVWNYFSQFFHIPYDEQAKTGISIGGLAYAYAFDDQGDFSTDISKDNPANTIVNIGTGSAGVSA